MPDKRDPVAGRDLSGPPLGATRTRVRYAAARRNLAIELWENTTWTVPEIAEFLGVSVYTVRRYYLNGAD